MRAQVTHLFKDVLHGNGRFVMVVNVSPAAEEFNETKRVLQVCGPLGAVVHAGDVSSGVTILPPTPGGAVARGLGA